MLAVRFERLGNSTCMHGTSSLQETLFRGWQRC